MFATWLVLRPLLERASAPCGILVGRCGVLPQEVFYKATGFAQVTRKQRCLVRQQKATRDAMVSLVATLFETAT